MSIFNDPTPPTPPTLPTVQELQAAALEDIGNLAASAMSFLINNFTASLHLVWNHPVLTPQQVFDAFGTNAVKFAEVSVATKEFINTLIVADGHTAPIPSTTPKTLTFNQDGTVTVGA